MNFKIFAAVAALCVAPSFAIVGIGFHYAPNFGTSMDAVQNEHLLDLSASKDGSSLSLG